MFIPMEDNFADVVGKAQRGLGLADRDLAARAGISLTELDRLKAPGTRYREQIAESRIRNRLRDCQ